MGILDTSTTLLGTPLSHPILLAPVAAHRLYHPEGELETLRGAAAGEALHVQSTMSTVSVEEVGAAARGAVARGEAARGAVAGADVPSPWWFQLYVQRDRDFTADLVARAEAAGASALVLTVDTPTLGARDRDRRGGLPPASYPNLRGLPEVEDDGTPAHRRIFLPRFDPTFSWETFAWLLGVARTPVVVKGVLRPDDAARAVEAGAAAVIVSNHGGRNLDTVPATVDALPGVVAAVGGRVPVLVDGGIRRGTDVAKALALGAAAVLVGRPFVWGLAADGADGVRLVIEMLRTELEMAMGLLGTPTLADLTEDALWPR